jgi:hypothetical protein
MMKWSFANKVRSQTEFGIVMKNSRGKPGFFGRQTLWLPD